MRILFITQFFEPEPRLKGLAFAKALQNRGHHVEVLTGFPNYPGGRVYPGYRIKPYQYQELDGIRVLRVPLYPSHDTSSIGRIVNYTSFSLSATSIGSLLSGSADIAYVYHPPATVGFPAIIHSLFRNVPFVYDVQDLWPDTLAATGMFTNAAAGRLLSKWCSFVYKRASKIVVLSPGFKSALMERGVPEDKIEIIYNWSRQDQSVSAPPRPDTPFPYHSQLSGRFNVVFAGTMGKAQALDSVLEAAGRVKHSHPDIQFVFIGAGIDMGRLKSLAEHMCLDNVLFLPRVPVSAISEVFEAADALLVHLKDDPLFRITIPSKIQDYLNAGRPILMAVEGDAAGLVSQSGAGITCKPGDPVSIADAVMRLFALSPVDRQAMGERGRRFYRNNLSLEAALQKFERVFTEIVHCNTTRPLSVPTVPFTHRH